MAKITLSPSQFLNIALGSVIAVGGFSTYKFANFDGVSFDELTEKYISKNDLKFSDLPQEIQKRYIDKEATLQQSKDASSLLDGEFLDEQGKAIPESEVSKQDLKRQITKLQKTLLFLQHDNLLITNEKNELAKKLEEEENEREDEKSRLSNKNTERLNEAEQQHFRNISDLTLKINELQKENVLVAQKANAESNALLAQIEDLKNQAVEAEKRKIKEIQKAREEEQSRFGEYRDKIKLLNEQIALLNEQLNSNSDSAKSSLAKKQEEVEKLKAELVKNAKEKSELIAQNNQALLTAEQKQKEEIAQYTRTIDQIKAESQKLVAQNNQEVAQKEQDALRKIALQEEKVKVAQNEVAAAQKRIDSLMQENEKDFNKFKNYLDDEKKLNQELKAANKRLEENAQSLEKTLTATLQSHKEELAKKEAQTQELNANITKLQNTKIDIEAEIKRRVDENDKVHNKNYKIFNEKIASFESSKKALTDSLDQQLNEYKTIAQKNYDTLQARFTEVTRDNDALKKQLLAKEQEQQNINKQLSSLQLDNQKQKESQESSLKSAQEIVNTLKADIKQKEESYLVKIKALESDIKARDEGMLNAKREETQRVAALEKEVKTRAIEAQKYRDESTNNASALKNLQYKMQEMEDNKTKVVNKQVEELKVKIEQIEKTRAVENNQLVALKDTLRVKEIEYLDALKAKDKEMNSKEGLINGAKDESKKLASVKAELEEQLKKLKEEHKQKEIQHLDELKALQNQIKSKEGELSASKKDETLKSIALEKELKAKETQLTSNNDAYQKLQAQKASLEEKLTQLKEESKKSELQHLEATKALQAEIKTKDSALNGSQKQETLKSLALEKELQKKDAEHTLEKEALSKRLSSAEQTIKTLNEKIALLETAQPKVAAATTPAPTTKSTSHAKASTGSKMVHVDSFMCTDMTTGVNAATPKCQQDAKAFLSKFDSSYFFEIIPIVDNGGFASLKTIKSKKVGVEDSEIDRISGLANIGLGKARAKVGGELVESIVGEAAKISYSLTNLEMDKARGFQIKVYQ